MILYFTGTGNSLYVAKKLLADGERLVSIADLMKKGEYTIELSENEKLGIVFPGGYGHGEKQRESEAERRAAGQSRRRLG